MVEKTFTIESKQGVHARPASMLVNHVSNFDGEVILHYKEKNVNLKSIMGVMGLGIPQGSEIKITADGEKEKEIIASLEEILKVQRLVK